MSRRAIHEQLNAALAVEQETPSGLPAPIERARRAPVASTKAQGLERGDLAGRLEHLTGKALDRADDILELEIDPEHEKFGESVRAVNSAIKTITQTQVRVDEHRLKQRNADALPEILEKIKAYEERTKAVA